MEFCIPGSPFYGLRRTERNGCEEKREKRQMKNQKSPA